jgi:hypothetical protein
MNDPETLMLCIYIGPIERRRVVCWALAINRGGLYSCPSLEIDLRKTTASENRPFFEAVVLR